MDCWKVEIELWAAQSVETDPDKCENLWAT
jgi:hypothetical protein